MDLSQITFFLSGGTNNLSPSLSLGGSPSTKEVTSSINNLFSRVTKDESQNGGDRYRCIYVFNNTTATLTNCQAWATSGTASEITLGIESANDFQRVILGKIIEHQLFNLASLYLAKMIIHSFLEELLEGYIYLKNEYLKIGI